jgi:hypothetical protein
MYRNFVHTVSGGRVYTAHGEARNDSISCQWGVSVELSRLLLDLRDVTARAHAAMAYTVVNVTSAAGAATGVGWVLLAVPPLDESVWLPEDGHGPDERRLTSEAEGCFRALVRMRMLDPSIYVAQARETLDFAHAHFGVTRAD